MTTSARTASGTPTPAESVQRSGSWLWIAACWSTGISLVGFAVVAAVQLNGAIASTPGRFDATSAPPLAGLLLALSDTVAPWVGSLTGGHDVSARLRSVELVTVTLVVVGVALVVVPRLPLRRGAPGRDGD